MAGDGWEAVWVADGWRWSATMRVEGGRWQGRVRSCGDDGWRLRSAVAHPVAAIDGLEAVSQLFGAVMDNHPSEGAEGAYMAFQAVLRDCEPVV